jgi:ketosteroid isomerase-like protein
MQGEKHKADEAAIRRLDEEWGKAASAKNLDAVVGFYAQTVHWCGRASRRCTAPRISAPAGRR